MSLLALAGWLVLQSPAPDVPTVLAGEAVKVDLGRRQLVVRTVEPPRETTFNVEDGRTRIASGGRPLALEGVRAGEWVLVAYQAAGLQPVALLVKVGAARPGPGPRR
jgi:hypothetical protein